MPKDSDSDNDLSYALRTNSRDAIDWREEQLTYAGVGPAAALILANSIHQDLHVMIAAKEAGCSDALMIAIFEDTPRPRRKPP